MSAAAALGRSADHLQTGLPDWDAVTHGGPVVGSTMLFYGPPGSGKTTEAIRLGGAIAARTSKKAIVLSCEMPEPLLAGYCARAGVSLELVDLWHVDTWRRARTALASPSYRAIIVDSVQPFARGDAKAVRALLDDLEGCTQAVRIVIARVNRDGNPSGVRDLDHDVDVVARITPCTIQIPLKNRFAPTPANARRAISLGSDLRSDGEEKRSGRRRSLRRAK